MAISPHRISPKGPKPPFFRNLSDALKKKGMPKDAWKIHEQLAEVIAIAEEARTKERLAERGTLDKQTAYVTDAGKECGRAIWLSNRSVEATNPPDTHAQVKFRVGYAFEDALTKLFEDAGHKVEREKHICLEHDGVEITGRIDFIIDDYIELKSTHAEQFKWIVARGEAGRAEHRTQLNLYLYYENTVENNPVEYGFLYYFITDAPKGTPSVLPFKVNYDKEKAEADIARLAHIWKLEQDPGVPPEFQAEFQQTGRAPLWPCVYCSYHTHCWSKKGVSA